MSKKTSKKRIRGDFHKKKYQNPFYKHANKDRQSRRKVKNIFPWLIFIAIIASIAWFLFMSSVFNIENIEVKKLTRNNPQEIKQLVKEQTNNQMFFHLFSESNIFIFAEDKLQEKLHQTYNFKKIDIKKELPDTLILTLKEKEKNFILKQGNNYYYANYDTSILEKIHNMSEVNTENHIIVENLTNNQKTKHTNQFNISEKKLKFLQDVIPSLKQNKDTLSVHKIQIPDTYNKIILQTKSGPEIYLSTENKAQEQIDNLITVKKKELKNSFSEQQYIDLRYQEKIYYQ